MAIESLQGSVILVPVDFDEPSRRAVSSAVGLARALQSPLVLLHVVPPTTFPEGTRLLPVDASDPVDLSEYVSARARRLLDDHFATILASGLAVRKEVRSGHVVETVLRALEKCDARLLVVGTHGRTGSARLVLGSVAESLVRRSPVPVMVVRDTDTDESAGARYGSFEGAAAVSGAVAGAATGAVGGPVGAVAGGAIGTIVGAIAGRVIAREDARAGVHDKELDDAIGVTQGSLGAPKDKKQPSPSVLADAARARKESGEADTQGVD